MPETLIDMLTWELLAFCAIAFSVAPIEPYLRLKEGKQLKVSLLMAVTLGSIIWLGPFLGWLPALFGILGRMTFRGAGSISIFRFIIECVRLPFVSYIAGTTYLLLGGTPRFFPAAYTIFPACGAVLVFSLAYHGISQIPLAKKVTEANGNSWKTEYGLFDLILSSTLGFAFTLYRAWLPPVALIPLPLIALVVHAYSLNSQPKSENLPESSTRIPSSQSKSPSLTFVDALTGLANENYVNMFLEQEINRSTRGNYPLTVMLFDLDDFASHNKKFGTAACDRMLAEIGAIIRNAVRNYDVVARYSSDNFVVVLPEASSSDSMPTAERIRAAIENYKPEWLGEELQITACGGIAGFPDHGSSADDLINSAHHAVNRAKFSGKNRVLNCHELARRAA